MAKAKLYSRADLAEYFGWAIRTVDERIRRGLATQGRDGFWPVSKCGRSVRVTQAAVDAYLERCQLGALDVDPGSTAGA